MENGRVLTMLAGFVSPLHEPDPVVHTEKIEQTACPYFCRARDEGGKRVSTILIADDDNRHLQLVKTHLLEKGYSVATARDGAEALRVLQRKKCDLAVVDVMMPFVDGFSLTREIRRHYDIPVLLLTAKDQLADKAEGYLAGTDDYLVKPFEPLELLFRVQALLRRYYGEKTINTITIGNMHINRQTLEVEVEGKLFFLPPKEYELLCFLADNANQAFSREQLIEQVWGLEFQGDDRTVDVHVKRLREHFKDRLRHAQIRTLRGIGYMLEVEE
jgi:DNA-binding response OmpR family regulator